MVVSTNVPGFLRRPWIQGQPWKVFKFHKTEIVLELLWKMSGRSWKVWNLPMWNFQQDLVTVRLPAIVAIKRVEELLRPLIINKRQARMLQIGVFFSPVPVGLYAIEWSTGRRPWIIEWKALKSLEFFRSSGAGTLCVRSLHVPAHLEYPGKRTVLIMWADVDCSAVTLSRLYWEKVIQQLLLL